MTPFDLAQRFVGEIRELPGAQHHPFIQWAHMLCALGSDQADETPWCSSFVNAICWLLEVERSRSAAARSWLAHGETLEIDTAVAGFDVVILKRGAGAQPGPEVLRAPGHVGFFADRDSTYVRVLGGNQSNNVTVQEFPRGQVLGVRRLRLERAVLS